MEKNLQYDNYSASEDTVCYKQQVNNMEYLMKGYYMRASS
jgi:hypothetical protein